MEAECSSSSFKKLGYGVGEEAMCKGPKSNY